MIGAIYDTQHGLTNAVLLPAILRFNASEIHPKVEMMNYVTFSEKGNFENFYSNICKLLDNLEIVKGINELGVENKKISELALKASKDAAAKTNQRLASIPEIEQLLLECLDRAR